MAAGENDVCMHGRGQEVSAWDSRSRSVGLCQHGHSQLHFASFRMDELTKDPVPHNTLQGGEGLICYRTGV